MDLEEMEKTTGPREEDDEEDEDPQSPKGRVCAPLRQESLQEIGNEEVEGKRPTRTSNTCSTFIVGFCSVVVARIKIPHPSCPSTVREQRARRSQEGGTRGAVGGEL